MGVKQAVPTRQELLQSIIEELDYLLPAAAVFDKSAALMLGGAIGSLLNKLALEEANRTAKLSKPVD